MPAVVASRLTRTLENVNKMPNFWFIPHLKVCIRLFIVLKVLLKLNYGLCAPLRGMQQLV